MLRPRHWRAVVIVAAIAAVGTFVAGLSSPDVRMQVAKSTTRQPLPFTELYFPDPRHLPKVMVGDGPFTFRFTIANHEGRAVDYRYLVTVDDAGGTTPITGQALFVASGQSSSMSVSLLANRIFTSFLVTVQLVGRPETIHFTATS